MADGKLSSISLSNIDIHTQVIENTNRVADLESNWDIPHFPINQYDQVCDASWDVLRVLPGFSPTDDKSNIQQLCRSWDHSKDPPIFVRFPSPVHKRDLRDVLCRRWNRDKSSVSGFEYFTYNSYYHEISLLKTVMNLETHTSDGKQLANNGNPKLKGGKMILEITSWSMFPEPQDLEVQQHFNSDWVGKNLHVRCALLIPSTRGNRPHGIYARFRQIPFPYEIHTIEELKKRMSQPRLEAPTNEDGSPPTLTSPRVKRSRSEVSLYISDIDADEQNRKRFVISPTSTTSSSSTLVATPPPNPYLQSSPETTSASMLDGVLPPTLLSQSAEATDPDGPIVPPAEAAPARTTSDVEFRFWDLGFSLSEDV